MPYTRTEHYYYYYQICHSSMGKFLIISVAHENYYKLKVLWIVPAFSLWKDTQEADWMNEHGDPRHEADNLND